MDSESDLVVKKIILKHLFILQLLINV